MVQKEKIVKIKKHSRSELIQICKEKNIKGYSKLKIGELRKLCLEKDVPDAPISKEEQIIQKDKAVEVKNYKKADLLKMCKEKNIKNVSKLSRDELLVKCFEENPSSAKKTYTKETLKLMCKNKNIRGYSKLNKAQLMEKCLGLKDEKIYSKSELLSMCKEMKIKGCYKMKIDELKKICLDKDVSKIQKNYSLKELYEICSKNHIPGYRKMKKNELMKICFNNCFGTKFDESLWDVIKIPGDHHCGFHAFLYAMDNLYPNDPKLPSRELSWKERILEMKKILIKEAKEDVFAKNYYKNIILDPQRWLVDHDLKLLANYFDVCICIQVSSFVSSVPFNFVVSKQYEAKSFQDCKKRIYLTNPYSTHYDVLFPNYLHIVPLPIPDRISMSSNEIFEHAKSILSQQDVEEFSKAVNKSPKNSISDEDLLFKDFDKQISQDDSDSQQIGQEQIIGGDDSPEQGQIIGDDDLPEQGQIIDDDDDDDSDTQQIIGQQQIIGGDDLLKQSEILEIPKQRKTKQKQIQKIPKRFTQDNKEKITKIRNVIEKCFSRYRVPDYLLTK